MKDLPPIAQQPIQLLDEYIAITQPTTGLVSQTTMYERNRRRTIIMRY